MANPLPRPWRNDPTGDATAARTVLQAVITFAEQVAKLSDEQLRSRLAALRGLVQ